MTKHLRHIILLVFSINCAYAQLSPGDLAQGHADLEGISNCTQCHDLGTSVSSAKCLDCHVEIQTLLDLGSGYHASQEVRAKECFDCHSDHHGRKFDMVRFDQDNFNHNLTGYELEGQHGVIDCRACHTSDYIEDPEIKHRADTFLGLSQECLACHDDFHQGTLSDNCISCHDIEAFRPAPRFDHDDADYSLKGKHIDVDCKECHPMTTRNGVEFQEFTDIPFNDCVACHDDPHSGRIEGRCTQCHTEKSFSVFTGQNKFNHNTTDFVLKGSHQSVDCFACHEKNLDPKLIFQDQEGVTENQCAVCHEDVHEGRFGNDCARCHQETSFLDLKAMADFDHNQTDYPLEGKHMEVDCRECHTERYSVAIDFSACKNCHDDYHRGEFAAENNVSPDCVECHSLEQGFDYSLYTIEQHQESSFPLEGAHLATPCFVCHISEEEDRWKFRDIGLECVDCHQDIHEGYISEEYYPENDCAICHINDTWASVDFDHNLTEWALEGKHQEVDCRDCHFLLAEVEGEYTQSFNDLNNDCIQCHENVHDTQFEIEGVTDCKRCHDAESWFPTLFNHDETAFPLEGKHAEIDCKECHQPILVDDETIIEYKIEKFECIDCHQ